MSNKLNQVKESFNNYCEHNLSTEDLLSVLLKPTTLKEIKNICNDFELSIDQWLFENDRPIGHYILTEREKILCIKELLKRKYKHSVAKKFDINSPYTIYEYLYEDLAYCEVEKIFIVVLDIKNKVINKKLLATGLINQCSMNMQLIFRNILLLNGFSFVLAHNHPSGNPEPSKEDLILTEGILQASKLMQIPFLDHIIVAKENWLSIRKESNLWLQYPQD